MTTTPPDGPPAALDLRALGVGAAGWAAGLAVTSGARWWVVAVLVAAVPAVVRLRQTGRDWVTAAAWLVAASAVAGAAVLAGDAVAENPVRDLAERGASVTAVVELRSDPVPVPGRFTERVAAGADVLRIDSRGQRHRVRAPVRLLLPADGAGVARGSTLRVAGVLARSTRPDQAAVLVARSGFEVRDGPDLLTTLGNRVRRAVQDGAAGMPPGPRGLVPALVDGQDGGLPEEVVEDFRTAGMTHLLAVSGTNLTLIVGCLLVLARWAGVRARALLVVGLLGVVGFLLLAGTEPSVLRAAAMGTIALLGLGSGGRQVGLRALGLGVLALVLLDPWLARSVGFALSVLATAGILLLAPPWRDALCRWLPRWAAEMIAVPLAAQLACTPLVAAISGQVSLVAVAANLLAAPLVAPATVLGLAGGLVALVSVPLGQLVAAPAGWCARGLIAIARQAAGLPVPAVSWSTSASALVLLTGLCVALACGLPFLLARRTASVLSAGALTVVVLVPLPTPGWPPPGWVLAACAVGQGDGLLLRVAARAAVVVDAGPDPALIDACLERFEVEAVPVVVLTHFHADHVDGLPGVLAGRRTGEVVTSPVLEPDSGVDRVRRTAAAARVPVRAVTPGETTRLGPVRWQVLAPARAYPDSDSPPNDGSVVLLVEVRGLRILFLGDQERPSQADLRRRYPGLRADVLKVAHHGSSKQDEDLVANLGARLAVISVGAGNDYGHPAPSALQLLRQAGMQVHRTDAEGDVAVVVGPAGRLSVATLLVPGR